MADQAERVILEAEDQVTPITDKANAALDGFEKKAESSHGKVIRISDQTRTSVQRLIASLEKQAETYGKSGVDRLITQRDQVLQRYNREPQAIDAVTKSYEKMIAMEEKAARESLAVKAAKEAEEALLQQSEAITSFGERVSQFMENPLQGAKGALSSVLTALGPFGIAVATGAAVLGTIAVSAFEAAKSLGEYGTRVKDAELRTGLAAKEVGQFGFAARAVGQDISIVERLMRGFSQAACDNSQEAEKVRATLRGMGIDLHTATGEMKPTSEILVEISEGLNKLPEGLQRDADAMDLFNRVVVEAIPFMTELNENLRVAHEQGFGPTEEAKNAMPAPMIPGTTISMRCTQGFAGGVSCFTTIGVSSFTTIGGWAGCCAEDCDQLGKLRIVRMRRNRRIVLLAPMPWMTHLGARIHVI